MGIGYLICAGNAGGLIGSFIYKQNEAPRYVTGYGNSLAFVSTGIVACLVLECILYYLNQKKAQLSATEVHARYTDEQLRELGEKSPLFQYKL